MTPKKLAELNVPLDDDDLDFLDDFLLHRFDDDIDTEDKDEGVADLATLDGMFTAIVSGPVEVPMSLWLPAMWGDFPYIWASKKEFEKISRLFLRHMNSIAEVLMTQPEDFEPIFCTGLVEGKACTIVDEWCEGYWRGVKLAEAEWLSGGDDITRLLTPVLAFTHASAWRGHELIAEEVDALQEAIAPNTRELHAFWLARRSPNSPVAAPLRRSDPRIGRNAPCPCGSGKKFKHCCLH
jgi:uncharacterized protein